MHLISIHIFWHTRENSRAYLWGTHCFNEWQKMNLENVIKCECIVSDAIFCEDSWKLNETGECNMILLLEGFCECKPIKQRCFGWIVREERKHNHSIRNYWGQKIHGNFLWVDGAYLAVRQKYPRHLTEEQNELELEYKKWHCNS